MRFFNAKRFFPYASRFFPDTSKSLYGFKVGKTPLLSNAHVSNARVMRLYTLSVNNLVTAYEYPGMTQVANKNLSAVNGLFATQFILNLYQFARLIKERGDTPPYYLQLVLELFHYQDTLRDTQLKTNPAYSLDPALIAKITTLLSGNIDSKDELLAIIDEWKSKHKSLTGKSYPSKIQHFLEICIQAKKEAMAPELGYLPETILLSFLHYKAKDRQDLINYTLELNRLTPFPEKDLLAAKTTFDEQDIAEGKTIFNKFTANPALFDSENFELILQDEIEKIIAYQFCKKLKSPPEVLQGTYRYNKLPDMQSPSCFETAFHNLFNQLLFDRTTQHFNLALLPADLKIEEALKKFYESQTIQHINLPEIGESFMNILADNPAFSYARAPTPFELETDPKNFLKVMSFLLGVSVTSFENLSKMLSTECRRITFSEQSLEDHFLIKITIEGAINAQEFQTTEEMRFVITRYHAYLEANYDSSQEDRTENIASLKALGSKVKNPMVRSLLYVNTLDYIPLEGMQTTIETLRQQFIVFPPESEKSALDFCREALLFSEEHATEIKHYLIHLHRRFFAERSSSSRLLREMLSAAESKESLAFLMNFFATELGTVFPGENSEEALRNLLNLPDSDGNTALYYAKNALTARAMIQAGALVNIKNSRFNTPLHVLLHDPEITKVLIEEGADIHAQGTYGFTPLHNVHHPETAKLLIESGAHVDATNDIEERPLHLAKDPRIVKILIDAGTNVNAPTKHGWAPINFARTPEIATLLIAAGADINVTSNIKGKTPLHIALTREDDEMVAVLIAAGADVNKPDKDGRTPLHDAQTVDMMTVLLQAGADPARQDSKGRVPLHYVRRPEILALLLKKGVDINVQDKDNRTPLHHACTREIFEALVEAGADITVQDNSGKTPLDYFLALHTTTHDAQYINELKQAQSQTIEVRL